MDNPRDDNKQPVNVGWGETVPQDSSATQFTGYTAAGNASSAYVLPPQYPLPYQYPNLDDYLSSSNNLPSASFQPNPPPQFPQGTAFAFGDSGTNDPLSPSIVFDDCIKEWGSGFASQLSSHQTESQMHTQDAYPVQSQETPDGYQTLMDVEEDEAQLPDGARGVHAPDDRTIYLQMDIIPPPAKTEPDWGRSASHFTASLHVCKTVHCKPPKYVYVPPAIPQSDYDVILRPDYPQQQLLKNPILRNPSKYEEEHWPGHAAHPTPDPRDSKHRLAPLSRTWVYHATHAPSTVCPVPKYHLPFELDDTGNVINVAGSTYPGPSSTQTFSPSTNSATPQIKPPSTGSSGHSNLQGTFNLDAETIRILSDGYPPSPVTSSTRPPPRPFLQSVLPRKRHRSNEPQGSKNGGTIPVSNICPGGDVAILIVEPRHEATKEPYGLWGFRQFRKKTPVANWRDPNQARPKKGSLARVLRVSSACLVHKCDIEELACDSLQPFHVQVPGSNLEEIREVIWTDLDEAAMHILMYILHGTMHAMPPMPLREVERVCTAAKAWGCESYIECWARRWITLAGYIGLEPVLSNMVNSRADLGRVSGVEEESVRKLKDGILPPHVDPYEEPAANGESLDGEEDPYAKRMAAGYLLAGYRGWSGAGLEPSSTATPYSRREYPADLDYALGIANVFPNIPIVRLVSFHFSLEVPQASKGIKHCEERLCDGSESIMCLIYRAQALGLRLTIRTLNHMMWTFRRLLLSGRNGEGDAAVQRCADLHRIPYIKFLYTAGVMPWSPEPKATPFTFSAKNLMEGLLALQHREDVHQSCTGGIASEGQYCDLTRLIEVGLRELLLDVWERSRSPDWAPS